MLINRHNRSDFYVPNVFVKYYLGLNKGRIQNVHFAFSVNQYTHKLKRTAVNSSVRQNCCVKGND